MNGNMNIGNKSYGERGYKWTREDIEEVDRYYNKIMKDIRRRGKYKKKACKIREVLKV